jgi:hypothetical protein
MKKFTTVASFSKVVFLILLVLLPFAGFYLGLRYQKPVAPPVTNKNSPTPQTSKTLQKLSKQFTSQRYGYTVTIPNKWIGEVEQEDSFEDVNIYSPDYQQEESMRGFSKGANIFIRVEETGTKDINEDLKKDVLWNEISTNVKKINIQGIKAIQYDYKYEGTQAVDTVFIAEGKKYLVKLDYSTGRNDYWKEYQFVLNTLEFKK